ncbi:uncharacterized protein LOC108811913 isoform X2 [Raphanus sativus]|uniref:Uncharacterized protein LOC108811913 isoform X2 n=1 Tax=Raphanus sativus TaxID=3726 RepID=A0A9W3C287_RAPSA|nr:uncharacterized protein LOC108811913 isoform X2 [Raphanus sativus]
MFIEVDSRRPLKFKRQVESPEGDEVTIEIKYEMLFKHCSTCGLMTHEKGHCLTLDDRNNSQTKSGDVFSRVQLPPTMVNQQGPVRILPHKTVRENERNDGVRRDEDRKYVRNDNASAAYYPRNRGEWDFDHRDRIIRGRDEHKRSRYGGSRYGSEPYARQPDRVWREKPRNEGRDGTERAGRERGPSNLTRDAIVPYEQTSSSMEISRPTARPTEAAVPSLVANRPTAQMEKGGKRKRLASAIVTPSGLHLPFEENVTIREKCTPRLLTFSPSSLQVEANGFENEQMIDALWDMEMVDQNTDDGILEQEIQDGDILGEDLNAMEDVQHYTAASSSTNVERRETTMKASTKMSVPLGIQTKKAEFLRRGSPKPRSAKPTGPADSARIYHRRNSSKKGKTIDNKSDGLMGSKNPSKPHQ